MTPVVTAELAQRVCDAEIDSMAAWCAALRSMPGNPCGAEARRFGGALALIGRAKAAGDVPSLGPLLHRVLGFGDGNVEALEELIAIYREKGDFCRIDTCPHALGLHGLRALTAAGFEPFRFHNHLYGTPVDCLREPWSDTPAAPGVSVGVVTAADLPAWTSVWRSGFLEVSGIDPTLHADVAAATARLIDVPGSTLYLAFVGGQPAAAAALHVEHGTASLHIAGTLPPFRRHGCQRALLRTRIAHAADLGCDLVVAQAALNAGSQHNMERAGLRIAYTRPLWLKHLQPPV
jgi:GNAT superfamily N-acetyltransferase